MTTITVAKNSGFCFGVKEAMKKAYQTIEEQGAGGKPIYSYGPIIHNQSVTDELADQGVKVIQDLSRIEPGSTVIIRSHGVPMEFYEEAKSRGVEVVDATCPYVKRIQQMAKEAWETGMQVVIVGDRDHPEVIGINGWCGNTAKIISTEEEARQINEPSLFVAAQTTITQDLWNRMIQVLSANNNNLTTHNTICGATSSRQKSCEELAQQSDMMIIIGGKSSSNSRKLYELSKKYCEHTYFVENKDDLPLKQVELCNRIGVAAGASTPERIIKEVISTMSEAITEKDQQVGMEGAEEAQTMHDLMEEIEKSVRLPGRGEIVTGEIHAVSEREIVVNLGFKKDGVIPRDEVVLEPGQDLPSLFKEGDTIQAKIIKTDDGDGNILLSRKKLEVNEHWDEINNAVEEKTYVNAKVVKEVKGGVIAVYKEVSGFIPMSQLSDRYVEKADEFIGKTLPVRVTRVDQKRNKAVFSHKAYLQEEKNKKVEEIWNSLKVGDVVEGTVMRFTDYGAFVDIGGIDGLLHISEISWGKLKHPQEALKIGQKVKVKIFSMNAEKGKISLGMKQNTPEPWSIIGEKYVVGQVVQGKVVQIKDYGAFVELEPGLDGLVHISEIAYKRVTNIANEIQIGQTVDARILEIDKDKKRISLSIKDTMEPPAPGYEQDEAEEADVDQAEEAAVEVAEKATEEAEVEAAETVEE